MVHRCHGFPLIQAMPDLGQVPRQPLVRPSDRMIGDAFEGLSGVSGIPSDLAVPHRAGKVFLGGNLGWLLTARPMAVIRR
jgi:hypothetical protein